jgi:hypothetical protein
MKQQSLGLGSSSKRTRKREFLGEMERVFPWGDLVALIAPYMPEGRRGRPPFAIEAMLRIHFMHVWTRRLLQALSMMFNGLHTCIRLARWAIAHACPQP